MSTAVDINQVRTGTVDSLCEQLLREFRAPGTQPPVLVDEFVSKTLMLREGLFGSRRDQNPALDAFLLSLYSDNGKRFNYHAGTKATLVKEIWERRFQDQVVWAQFPTGRTARKPACAETGRLDAQQAYETALRSAGLVDFSLLEDEVLKRVCAGQLKEFTDELKVVLVDEYQDTNLMQEQLYFELAAACSGALVVVGDDDQSLYRFRGATVDLFRDFPARYQQRFQKTPTTVFLTNNYRSTKNIVSFVNGYATLDAGYQAVRVASKPALAHGPKAPTGLPVLGMFRDTVEDLAADLAQPYSLGVPRQWLRGCGWHNRRCAVGGRCRRLCAPVQQPGRILCVEQASSSAPVQTGAERAHTADPGLQPERRGRRHGGCGGALWRTSARVPRPRWCFVWPDQRVSRDAQNGLHSLAPASDELCAWAPSAPVGLLAFAQGWANRDPGRKGFDWPKSTTAIELIYGLVHYLPELHDDPEGQVYLEVFTRQLGACQQLGKFDGRVITDPTNQGLSDASVRELLRDFLAPIAEGVVDVNEELMETFPRDRLSVLSVHQSKGLEFPLTIVDVGSDFKDLRAPAFKRMPTGGGPPHRMEDLLRPHSPSAFPRARRSTAPSTTFTGSSSSPSVDPQDVLLLVGVTPTRPGGRVPNVATGWDRSGVCHWAATFPFEMI